ncbi:MAG: hypothetical protein ACRD88_14175, partial [Terriglobia bacterium]
SLDGGQNWTAINSGFTERNHFWINLRSLAIDSAHPETVYLGTAGGLLKTINSGENWQPAGAE